MGRRKKERTGDFDRIGERVTLSKCPVCIGHPNCFANINGVCTALNHYEGQGCSFFKDKEQALEETRKTYHKLISERRFDLLQKYHDTFYALGVVEETLAEKLVAIVNMKAAETQVTE